MHHKNTEKKSSDVGLARKYSFSEQEIKHLFDDFLKYLKMKEETQTNTIPLSVFNAQVLAPLEIVVKYLREELGYSYVRIAQLLNRKSGPIGVTYRNAKRKFPKKLEVIQTEYSIPIPIFQDSQLTIFETIVLYLKDSSKLKFNEIATLLHRNYRTIWTVYNRALIKNE